MSEVVSTALGRLTGAGGEGVDRFLGIPFARPPTGPLRFRAPEPPTGWSGTRDASRYGPSAPQRTNLLSLLPGMEVGATSEDCLYLNLWRPSAAARRAPRPVLVWIHGGGFVIGSGSQPIYEASALALRADAVVVTLNYRLGALGFLHREGRSEANANAGLLDQIAALHWVREHVADFGGDPDNVTIFGESAGGMSVGTLLGTPAARGLFRRAIPQSGAAHNVHSADAAAAVADRLASECGVPGADADALRALPIERLLDGQEALLAESMNGGGDTLLPFQPVVDGRALERPPLDAIRAGLSRDVSLLLGTTRDEWKLFGLLDPTAADLDEAELARRCETRVPGHGRRLAAAYRTASEARGGAARALRDGRAPAWELLSAFETDRVFRIPALRLAEAQLGQGARVFTYLVTWESPALGGSLGACHAIELGLVFGTLDCSRTLTGDGPGARHLSERMMDAWGSFAHTGSPATPQLSEWRPYTLDERSTLLLGRSCRIRRDPAGALRRAWEGLL